MINPSVGVVLVAMSTVNTAVMIGLGFFYRPSRASAIWACAFTLAMLTAYGWVAADALGSHALRAACAALLLGATTFIWVGLRVRRGAARSGVLPAGAFTLASVVALTSTAELEVFPIVFRWVFSLGAVFAALTLVELVRLGPHRRHVILPLALASAGFLVFAVLSKVDAVARGMNPGAAGPDQLELIRDLNSMASIVYSSAALVTLLLLTRESPTSPRTGPTPTPFRAVAQDRLDRARRAGDRWWCVLDIRLDDPLDVREAYGTTDFARIADRFVRDVRDVLPPDADIEVQDESGIVALLPRPEGAVRQLLSRLLDRVATPDPTQPIAVRVSASVGWASVDANGYDLDDLLTAARAAGANAHGKGGDRWERAAVHVG